MNKRSRVKERKSGWWEPFLPLIGPLAWILAKLAERLMEREVVLCR